jgi:hypothetical protein
MANLDSTSKNLIEFSRRPEKAEETRKVYLKPSLLKYGEITKLTMKVGTYLDAATFANDYQP